ncbi:MAG TPA: sulfotransferase [Acidimicrobiia bacterium]
MQADELVAAARRETGLDDLGPESYREGLEVLVAALIDEAQLSDVGRLALESQITANLANRLRVTDWTTRHPELADERIERPVFILGMPRTGTTFLSYLFDQDPATRSLMRWESMNSVPPPEAATFTTDLRIAAARESATMLDTLNPGFKAVHYEAPDGPTECVAVLSQDFKSILWETIANVPSYGKWIAACDYTSAYEYHRRVLQLLQSRAPGRWVLKSPGHRLALDAVTGAYPDARFVVTHRDPVKVVASVCSLIASLSGTFSDADHRAYIAEHWTGVLTEMVTRVERFRERKRRYTFVDIAYADLVADPVGTVLATYDALGDELTPAAKAAMSAYASDNRQGKYGRHAYELAELGLDRGDLEARFAAYRNRYDIPPEDVA